MEIPEGVATVESEGGDLKRAIAAAAQELGLAPNQVDYKLDLSHFRSALGTSMARDSVKIIAWGSDRPDQPEEQPRRKRKRERQPSQRASDDGESRKKDKREPAARKPERLRGPEESTTEASEFAEVWFRTLLTHMSLEGKVTGTGNEERVHLSVTADRAGRIIGKRGSTLGAIRHLLGLALEKNYGALVVDVDVDDDRPKDQPRPERQRRSRDRNRGGRGSEKGRYPAGKLKALARRAAEKAKETSQTITINLELNSYDRRIVHMEVAEVEGVSSRSEERSVTDDNGGETRTKLVLVVPDDE